jgi:pimeloyl-ACP methyl ester carboxylesterase
MELSDSYFDTGEVRLHVMEGPRNGPPLVLLHGATGRGQDWQPILPQLLPRWHVYLVDMRGHGLSDRSPNGQAGYHISAFVRDTVALLQKRVNEPAVLFGHSWGALTALLTAAQIECHGLTCLQAVVAEDPPVMIYRDPPEMAPFLGYFGQLLQIKQAAAGSADLLAGARQLNTALGWGRSEAALVEWSEKLGQVDTEFLKWIIQGSQPVGGIDFAHAFEKIRYPTLLLQADPASLAAFFDQDLELVMGQVPEAQHAFFAGCGHNMHNEQPHKVVQVFEGFIESMGN